MKFADLTRELLGGPFYRSAYLCHILPLQSFDHVPSFRHIANGLKERLSSHWVHINAAGTMLPYTREIKVIT